LESTHYRTGKNLHYKSEYIDRSPHFLTENGFEPRVDFRKFENLLQVFGYPKNNPIINSTAINFSSTHLWDYDSNQLENTMTTSFELRAKGDTYLSVHYLDKNVTLRPKDFSSLSKNTNYKIPFWDIWLGSRIHKKLNVLANLSIKENINFVPPFGQVPAKTEELFGQCSIQIQPVNQLKISNFFLFSDLRDKNFEKKILRNEILRSNWNWQFSKELSLRFIFQWESLKTNEEFTFLNDNESFNYDLLLTYFMQPGRAFYLGYNTNFRNLDLITQGDQRELIRTKNDFLNDAWQVFFKASFRN